MKYFLKLFFNLYNYIIKIIYIIKLKLNFLYSKFFFLLFFVFTRSVSQSKNEKRK